MERLNLRKEEGFTLVELAIVMIIIGLLLAGVLKGQEMISNAEVTATVAQVKAYDAATTTFRDKYGGFPGDITRPETRIPNCDTDGGCDQAGNGNGLLDNNNPLAAPTGEGLRFFVHLSAADLITGIRADGANDWGDIYPEAEIAGGFQASSWPGGPLGHATSANPGHYLTMVLSPDTATAANDTLNANEAARIDRKLDDGRSNSGGVFADGATCDDAAGVYDEAEPSTACDLIIRFQG